MKYENVDIADKIDHLKGLITALQVLHEKPDLSVWSSKPADYILQSISDLVVDVERLNEDHSD